MPKPVAKLTHYLALHMYTNMSNGASARGPLEDLQLSLKVSGNEHRG